jgi:type IV secretory pathway TrbD component
MLKQLELFNWLGKRKMKPFKVLLVIIGVIIFALAFIVNVWIVGVIMWFAGVILVYLGLSSLIRILKC